MMTRQRGLFITVEGQDGAGKSTNIDSIVDEVRAFGLSVLTTREPGGTELGEQLRSILLDINTSKINDLSETLMMFSARSQHLEQVILPALERGEVVICDRFTDASYAYQGGGRGVCQNHLQALEEMVHAGTQPNLTILLDVPIAIGQQRTESRGEGDRFDEENRVFKERVRASYLQRAKEYPERIKVIDASESLEAVGVAVAGVVNEFLRLRGLHRIT